jgi:glycosyltransferase involved in cell wall biosynthesis
MAMITVLMAVRNSQMTVCRAIQSIINQTHTDWKLLIFDDSSTDKTVEEIMKITDPRVELHQSGDRHGQAAGLNYLLPYVRSPYIARMDADDIAHPERFALQLDFMNCNVQIDVIGSQILTFSEDRGVISRKIFPASHNEIVQKSLLGRIPMAHPAWFCRTEWLRKNKYDERFLRAQDFEILFRSRMQSRFGNHPAALLAYNTSGATRLSNRIKKRFYVLMAIALNLKGFGRYALVAPYFLTLIMLLLIDVIRSVLPKPQSRAGRSNGEGLSSQVEEPFEVFCLKIGEK